MQCWIVRSGLVPKIEPLTFRTFEPIFGLARRRFTWGRGDAQYLGTCEVVTTAGAQISAGRLLGQPETASKVHRIETCLRERCRAERRQEHLRHCLQMHEQGARASKKGGSHGKAR